MAYKDFGDNVKRLRHLRGWTQTQLAEHSGLGRATINRIEANKTNPGGYVIDVLTRTLQCTVADLFEDN